MKPRSIGPDKKPLSTGPEPGPETRGIGPDLTEVTEFRGIGWSGIEANKFELSKAAALSSEALYGPRSIRAVERAVEVLAEIEAPEMVRKAVF